MISADDFLQAWYQDMHDNPNAKMREQVLGNLFQQSFYNNSEPKKYNKEIRVCLGLLQELFAICQDNVHYVDIGRICGRRERESGKDSPRW